VAEVERVSGVFAQILHANRSRYNAKFAEARWRRPKLEPEAWAALLRTTVAPLVEAVDGIQPDQTAQAADPLYEMALDLLGQELLGPRSPYPAIVAGWETLLPGLARFVAASPRQVAGSVTNALYNLSTTRGARPYEWISSLLSLGEICGDTATLLRAGQVAAWRAGLAHYRFDALEICTQLAVVNVPVARAALGLPADDPAPLENVIDRLWANPWLSPTAAARGTPAPQMRLVARVGDFRGLGGEFLTPPLVMAAEGRLVVNEGQRWWWLTADVFGATLHRAPELGVKPQTAVPPAWKRSLEAAKPAGYPHPQTITSLAATETTLAATSSLSHRVHLLARVPPDEASELKPHVH
jgi:hypothetical protein